METGFLRGLLPYYTGVDNSKSIFSINRFVKDVRQGDSDGFLERMQAFFEDVELHSARGSADMTIRTKDYVYLMEFKVDKSPDVALEQIEKKGYAAAFAKDSRTLFKIGVEFSLAERNITRWKILC